MIMMQKDGEIAALNWPKETQEGYIRIATLILLSKSLTTDTRQWRK